MSEHYLDVVRKERSLLEKILTVFPGYRGYREKEVLRETDQLIRNTLFHDLKSVSRALREAYRSLAALSDRIDDAKKVEKLWMRVDAYAERVRHAERGYAPLMNVIQVNEPHILRLMDFDARLAERILILRKKAEKVKDNLQDKDLLSKDISDIEEVIAGLEEDFSKREEVMYGLIEVK